VLSALTDFAGELRAIGVPVSMVEVIDAADALEHVDLADREGLRATLSATMVKNARHQGAFDTAFDVFFGVTAAATDEDAAGDATMTSQRATGSGGAGSGGAELQDLIEGLLEALGAHDAEALRGLVRRAVDQLSGFQPGRPVGGRYYLYRVMHRLNVEDLRERLVASALEHLGEHDAFDERLAKESAADQVAFLRQEVQDEILRRLVEDRGPEAVAKTLRTPLVEDLDLMHATREELDDIAARIGPLARKLATRLAARRRHGRRGRLDVRRTIRRSLAHGGALVDPQWKPRRISKPELVLLCDVSGSMATFARFTMQLTFAIGHQFSNVRSFAFIDGMDEVTGYFGVGADFHDAMAAMTAQAQLVRRDGHSDYGSALAIFAERYTDAVTPRSTVIVTGDARNNYRDSGLDILAEIARKARTLQWLNPEASRYWDTGDSIMSTYGQVCDDVHEVRTLRQLERFVERIALRPASIRPVRIGR
jgi:uncharacterized protein with von Willebrand factor type A (vWA) domain